MNGITAWMEKHIVPVAGKIGSQKHLVALRDAFIGMLPATMAGALAVLIIQLINTVPQVFQQLSVGTAKFATLKPTELWTLKDTPILSDILQISSLVNQGTMTIIGLIFAFSWGYNLARAYGVNDLAGGIVSVATLFIGLPDQMAKITAALTGQVTQMHTLKDAKEATNVGVDALNGVLTSQSVAAWKPLFAAGHLDAGAYFTVIIMGAIAVIIYSKLMLANITIKMPDSVPPAVSKAFLAIIPTVVALYVVSIIYYVITKLTNDSAINLISKYIASPLQQVSQSLFSVLLMTALVSILWFFGLHGPNVLAPALDGIWQPLQLNNQALFGKVGAAGIRDLISKGAIDQAHAIDGNFVNLWVRGSWDAYAWFGGSGGTITLVIAILLFSKRKDYKMVGRLGLAPGLFNINEPVLFGLPVVLNPIMIIPFIVAPLVSVIIAYAATVAQLVDPVVSMVPWVTPPVLHAFMSTGFDWRAALLAIINIGISFVIWVPFVLAANKLEETELD